MDWITWGYFGLFVVTFLAATVLPFSSEAIVILFLVNEFNPLVVFVIASLGNSLGSVLNFEIGRLGKPQWMTKFGVPKAKITRFETKVVRYGYWLGFLVWLPIIGDAIAIALGYFKAKRMPSYLTMSLGKMLRYGAIILGFYFFS